MFTIGQILNKENYTKAAIWCNANGAHIEKQGGQYVLAENAKLTDTELNASKIAALKAKLSATDYKAIKYAEGLLSEEEYAETKALRQAWRYEINALEAPGEAAD